MSRFALFGTIGFIALILNAAAADPRCWIVSNGLKICEDHFGAAVHRYTSDRRGEIVYYELLVPVDTKGADFLVTLVPAEMVLLPAMKPEARGALMLRILKTALDGGEVSGGAYIWKARRDGANLRIAAERR